jgi:hypothetical protein
MAFFIGIRMWMERRGGGVPPLFDFLLQENSDFILQENGDKIIL